MTHSKPMISTASFVISAPESEVVFCDLDGEIALLQLQHGIYFGLNAVGARVWHLLGAGRLVCEVRDALLAEFEVDAAQCERDLLLILEQMAESELIKVRA